MGSDVSMFRCECGCRSFHVASYTMPGDDGGQAIDWIECKTCEARYDAVPRPSRLDRRD